MKQKIYQVDAFTNMLFHGNPAAVCPLDSWPGDKLLQNIALENNLSETAFYVRDGDKYHIRWFTPSVEVDLCGHATLAAAFVIFSFEKYSDSVIQFESRKSGLLSVSKSGDLLTLNFPADRPEPKELTKQIINCFNIRPVMVFKGKTDYMLVFKDEKEIISLSPEINNIALLDCRGVIVTAPGNDCDFVSRFFGPQSGVNEDPVTGSAHTTLTPYWSDRTGKNELTAIQLSSRKGKLGCRISGERVEISGSCRLYMAGDIFLD